MHEILTRLKKRDKVGDNNNDENKQFSELQKCREKNIFGILVRSEWAKRSVVH